MRQTLYYHGSIITVNDEQPTAEAVLVEEGIIKAVGDYEKLRLEMKYDAEQFDLCGHTLLPGFIDGHSHMLYSAMFPRFDGPPVGNIDSIEKLVASAQIYLRQHPIKNQHWLVGMGYDNYFFANHRHPTVEDMDRISTEVPVLMMHYSGHIGVCNSKVLELCGITKDSPNPEGGIIYKNPLTGEPTGVVEELALTRDVLEKMPLPTEELIDMVVLRSQDMYLQNGITTVQDGTIDPTSFPMLEKLYKKGLLHVDICGYVKLATKSRDYLLNLTSRGQRDKRGAKLIGAKIFLDGSPQAKTAWMSDPYMVPPEGEDLSYCGYQVYEDDNKVCDFIKDCLEHRWQIIAHCNGDAAIEQFISQYERAQKETGIYDDLRPVAIHCQMVRFDQLDRMKKIGMMPSYFHDHVYFWGDWHLDSVLGMERGSRISPLAATLARGIPFTLHQDCPVAPPNMMLSIHNAVNRKTASGREIGPQFTVSPLEAIRSVTLNAAYQYFEEHRKGSIEPGKVADFVVLDANPLTVPKDQIKYINVVETIKDDKVVFSKKK